MESTPEVFVAPINGAQIPTRVWRGETAGGIPCDVYVLSVVPDDGYEAVWEQEKPPYMPNRTIMTIDGVE